MKKNHFLLNIEIYYSTEKEELEDVEIELEKELKKVKGFICLYGVTGVKD